MAPLSDVSPDTIEPLFKVSAEAEPTTPRLQGRRKLVIVAFTVLMVVCLVLIGSSASSMRVSRMSSNRAGQGTTMNGADVNSIIMENDGRSAGQTCCPEPRSNSCKKLPACPAGQFCEYIGGNPQCTPLQRFYMDFSPVEGGIHRACRGKNSKDNLRSFYSVVHDVSLDDCAHYCSKNLECKGIEYSADARQCEIWVRPEGIGATARSNTAVCYAKNINVPITPALKPNFKECCPYGWDCKPELWAEVGGPGCLPNHYCQWAGEEIGPPVCVPQLCSSLKNPFNCRRNQQCKWMGRYCKSYFPTSCPRKSCRKIGHSCPDGSQQKPAPPIWSVKGCKTNQCEYLPCGTTRTKCPKIFCNSIPCPDGSPRKLAPPRLGPDGCPTNPCEVAPIPCPRSTPKGPKCPENDCLIIQALCPDGITPRTFAPPKFDNNGCTTNPCEVAPCPKPKPRPFRLGRFPTCPEPICDFPPCPDGKYPKLALPKIGRNGCPMNHCELAHVPCPGSEPIGVRCPETNCNIITSLCPDGSQRKFAPAMLDNSGCPINPCETLPCPKERRPSRQRSGRRRKRRGRRCPKVLCNSIPCPDGSPRKFAPPKRGARGCPINSCETLPCSDSHTEGPRCPDAGCNIITSLCPDGSPRKFAPPRLDLNGCPINPCQILPCLDEPRGDPR